MNLYRLHVIDGIEEPEDWTRVLIPFAGSGLRIHEEFRRDCVVEAGSITIKEIMAHLYKCVELFDYDPSEKEMLQKQSGKTEETNPWW